MSEFIEACEQVTEALRSGVLAGSSGSAIERLSDPLRLQEAETVAPCAERFVDYEVEPPSHGKAVGQATGLAMIPPLAKLVGEKKIGHLESAGIGELRKAIDISLAWGYLALASFDEVSWRGEAVESRVDLDPAELWQLWLPYLSSGLDGLRTPGGANDRTLKSARAEAMGQFTTTLKELDLLPKRLKRVRLKLVGQKYFDDGMILRLVQGASDQRGAPGFSRNMVERNWPFEPDPPEAQ